jgi:hypothetical protein
MNLLERPGLSLRMNPLYEFQRRSFRLFWVSYEVEYLGPSTQWFFKNNYKFKNTVTPLTTHQIRTNSFDELA